MVVLIPAKYAYVPFGKSGVLQYLPLLISKSPEFVNLWSSIKNPAAKLLVGGRLTTCVESNSYPDLKTLDNELLLSPSE